MVNLERGQLLHIRACRGETLTIEERTELESWYAEMDAEEARILNTATMDQEFTDSRYSQLRQAMSDVKSTLEQIG
jgi:hypothetical protein